jgi:hypothetical protein
MLIRQARSGAKSLLELEAELKAKFLKGLTSRSPGSRFHHEQFHRQESRRPRRRRHGRADRRPLRQCEGSGGAVRPAGKEGPKNGIVLKAIEGLKKLSPAPLGNKDDASCIEVANYDDNLELLKGCDLIIEAIAERMDWKHDLYKKVAPFIAPNAIFASNTSGLSITACPTASTPASRRASAACISSTRRATCTWSS